MIQEMYSDLHARHLHLYVNVPASISSEDLKTISANADGVVLMNYDQHEVDSSPGPIASTRLVHGQSRPRPQIDPCPSKN